MERVPRPLCRAVDLTWSVHPCLPQRRAVDLTWSMSTLRAPLHMPSVLVTSPPHMPSLVTSPPPPLLDLTWSHRHRRRPLLLIDLAWGSLLVDLRVGLQHVEQGNYG